MREKLVRNVRCQSAAGWYLGTVVFCVDNVEPYEKDSMYLPSEESVKSFYPQSRSMAEAVAIARRYGWTEIELSEVNG